MAFTPIEAPRFFNATQARWLMRVLGMLTTVVGVRSCLGVILAQARGEIGSLLHDAAGVEHGGETLENDYAAAA